MNFAQLNAFGIPSQVVDCIEGDEPGSPGLTFPQERFLCGASPVVSRCGSRRREAWVNLPRCPFGMVPTTGPPRARGLEMTPELARLVQRRYG